MRPHYETEEDLRREREIMRIAARRWNLQFLKLSDPRLDFSLGRRKRMGYSEVKNRTPYKGRNGLSFGYGDGYYLSMKKIDAAEEVDLPTVLIVCFRDGTIKWTYFSDRSDRVVMAGRWDRNDPEDIEPMAVFPWESFRDL